MAESEKEEGRAKAGFKTMPESMREWRPWGDESAAGEVLRAGSPEFVRFGGTVINLHHLVSFEPTTSEADDGSAKFEDATLYFTDGHKMYVDGDYARTIAAFFETFTDDQLRPQPGLMACSTSRESTPPPRT